jgi:hypothetical protein
LKYETFLAQLAAEYPKTASEYDVRSLVIPSLIAPVELELPKTWWDEAERLVSLFHNRIRNHPVRSEELRTLEPVVPRVENASVLMSYDFHVDFSRVDGSADPTGRLRLIEINTNASMSMMIDLMNAERALKPRCHGCRRFKEELLDDFAEELGRPLRGARIAIVDEAPSKQKMYIEFLMYKELFEARGAESKILDRSELEMRDGELWAADFGPIDLVYNRTTDFYFVEPASRALREALVSRATVITPGPFDYRMLADKDRMVEWSSEGFLETAYGLTDEECQTFRSALLRTREVLKIDPEILWKERKALIFKPRHAFGGKGVFRGSSISRGAFDGVIASDALAQDFVPAPTTKIDGIEFKFDLRFFAYRDRIHVACARIYQGQMTNATTPGGGVAPITWL